MRPEAGLTTMGKKAMKNTSDTRATAPAPNYNVNKGATEILGISAMPTTSG